jgi:hypothetical protein
LDKLHEGVHLHQSVPGTNWMENLFFGGHDDDADATWGIHLKLRPDSQRAELRVYMDVGGQNLGFGGRYPLVPAWEYPAYTAECLEPFRHWRLSFQGEGHPRERTGGLSGLEIPALGGTGTPFGFDIEITSRTAVGDWALLGGVNGSDSAGHGHYDMGLSWSGRLRIGKRTVEAKGLGMRDHSWGPRNFGNMGGAWFGGLTFEDERAYFGGVSTWTGETVTGFSYLIEGEKFTQLPRPQFNVLEGEGGPGEYRKMEIVTDGVRLVAQVRKHNAIPLLPERYLSGHGISSVETGTGRGYGMIERGLLFAPAKVDAIKAETGAVS